MQQIYYIDRFTGKKVKEPIFWEQTMRLMYRFALGRYFCSLLASFSGFSILVGWFYRLPFTKKKIRPFANKYGIQESDFEKTFDEYSSFNDFFIRKLAPNKRIISGNENTLIAPVDGRYKIYSCEQIFDGLELKNKKISLKHLLQDEELAKQYSQGSLVYARLAPFDYHRFHFPCKGIPSIPQLIKGKLNAVHPFAMKKKFHTMCENKRMITTLDSPAFGRILYIEVGALNVGSIQQTFFPCKPCLKGDEKGFFAFGASTVLMLFLKNVVTYDSDILQASEKGLEVLCSMGQSLGKASQE